MSVSPACGESCMGNVKVRKSCVSLPINLGHFKVQEPKYNSQTNSRRPEEFISFVPIRIPSCWEKGKGIQWTLHSLRINWFYKPIHKPILNYSELFFQSSCQDCICINVHVSSVNHGLSYILVLVNTEYAKFLTKRWVGDTHRYFTYFTFSLFQRQVARCYINK